MATFGQDQPVTGVRGKTGNRAALSDAQRCTATSVSTHRRCTNARQAGLTVCHQHGGATKASQVKSAIARVLRDSPRIAAIDADDPEANGQVAFMVELRRTIGRIRFAEDKIAALKADEDMIFGVSEIEAKDAPTNYGPNGSVSDASFERTQWEAKINGWVESERWNRAHLLKLTTVWISAGLEERRIRLEEEKMALVEAAIAGIVEDLGHDAADPDVRAKVRNRLMGLGG